MPVKQTVCVDPERPEVTLLPTARSVAGTALGGLDALVFSGGIGENSPQIRPRICEGLEFLGIQLDEQENAKNENLISQPDRGVEVRVTQTNEELMVANATLQLLDLI